MKTLLTALAVTTAVSAFANLRVGVAEKELDVPLFAELYGYGPYDERRQMEIHDPLYVRAYSFA